MSEEGGIYYFAYGANMNFNTFLERCSGAKFVDAGILLKHRFSINSRGVATVLMDESALVYGILWMITPEHMRMLDWYEGVHEGYYTRQTLSIEYESTRDQNVNCLVYVATEDTQGFPREEYLEDIIYWARKYRFPLNYVEHLITRRRAV